MARTDACEGPVEHLRGRPDDRVTQIRKQPQHIIMEWLTLFDGLDWAKARKSRPARKAGRAL